MRTIIILGILMSSLCFGQTQKLSPLPKQLQGTLPSFKVLAIDNKTALRQDDLKANATKAKAKRIVLSLFATWCVNCPEEFALLKKNAAELQKNGVQVYLINVGQSIHEEGNKVNDMVNKYAGNSFPLYFDPNKALLKDFGFTQEIFPLIVVLDADLRILSVLSAISKEDFPQILWNEF